MILERLPAESPNPSRFPEMKAVGIVRGRDVNQAARKQNVASVMARGPFFKARVFSGYSEPVPLVAALVKRLPIHAKVAPVPGSNRFSRKSKFAFPQGLMME